MSEDEYTEIPGQIPNEIRYRVQGEHISKIRSGPRPISEIEEKPIEWFWEPYIPLGRLSMLGGDPGAGKSFITTELAATLSKGGCFPGDKEPHEAGNTLMLAVEDDPADTIKPRLRNLSADLSKIFITEDEIVLEEDGFKAIKLMIKKTNAKLVIIDPIVAFLGSKMDMNRANEVRQVMKGLSKIAREFNIAMLVVRHNRKENAGAGNTKAIYAGMGSIDFTASVRSELAVTTSPNGLHFLNHIKANSGMKGKSLTYSIRSLDDGSGMFEWGDFANWPPDRNSTGKISKTPRDSGKVKRWLFDLLKNHPEGISSNDVHELGKASGFSVTKLDHSKKGLVNSKPRGGTWYWELKSDAKVDLSSEGEV